MKRILILVAAIFGIQAQAMTLDELAQYDCQGVDEGPDVTFTLQTREPDKKSDKVMVLKKQNKDSSFEVRNNVTGEKGSLVIESDRGGVLKMMVVPNGYAIGPDYKCKKINAAGEAKPSVKPAVQ